MSKLLAIKEEAERTTELDEGIAKLKQAKDHTLATLKGNVIGKEREALEKTFDDQIKEAEARKLSEKSCLVKLRCYMKKLDSITSHVYVADADNKRIQVVTEDGTHVMDFGSKHLVDSCGVALTEQYVYATDHSQHTILQFSRDGAFIEQVGGRGTAPLQFNTPNGIAAYNNKLYVCDLMNHRIQILNLSLKFTKEFTDDVLDGPSAIHITDTAIYVLPQLGNTIYLFSHTTHAVMQTVTLTGQEYNMETHFFFAVDLSGNYLISAENEHSIHIFDKTGALRHIIGKDYMPCPAGIQ